MKIAIITYPTKIPPDGYGGIERTIYTLAKKFAEDGHEITVFAGPESQITGCEIKSFVEGFSLQVPWIKQKLLSIKHMIKCYRYIGKEFDLIYNNVHEEGIALSFLSKVPVITNIHGGIPTKFFTKIITKLSALTNKTKLIAVSESAYQQNKKFYGDDLLGFVYPPIHVLPEMKFTSVPVKKHKIELCFVGALAPWKGPQIAMEIARRLHEKGFDIKLKIAAARTSDNTYTKKISTLIKNKEYIEFLGELKGKELSFLYKNSDALLFPILWEEPFGLVMIEAMYCGTPVIAFPRGSVPEIVKNGFNGYICNNIEEMCSRVLSINKIKREDCHEYVQKKFNVEKIAAKYIEFFYKVKREKNPN